MKHVVLGLFSLASACVLIGCARLEVETKNGPNAGGAASKSAYILAVEPAGAKEVLEIRQNGKDGDEVVVVGRIGGSETVFTDRASFTIVDKKFKPCNEIPGDNCPTPWDYCCDAAEVAKGMVLVKFVDANGKTLKQNAKEMLSVKELQTVVVKGHIRRDENNSMSVVATGIYIKG